MEKVLKLNADYSPIGVVSWMEAIILVLEGKADLIEGLKDRVIRSVSKEFQMPAVIRLRKYVRGLGAVGCSRENVLSRDNYTCQYCGSKPRTHTGKPILEDLTIDHVIPRALAKGNKVFLRNLNSWKPVSSWENLVCACVRCNRKKGSLSLGDSGLTLMGKMPQSPDHSGRIWIILNKHKIPDEWKNYLPQNSEWRGYWDQELED